MFCPVYGMCYDSPTKINTRDIIIKVKIETVTLENITPKVCIVKSPKAREKGPQGGAGKEWPEK